MERSPQLPAELQSVNLMPGVSHVIQQDYHWPHTPWISITMELLGDHVTYLGSMPWATACYRWERALDPATLPARLRDLDPVRLVTLATRAQRCAPGTREWTAQQCNIVALYLWLGMTTEAETAYSQTLAAAPDWIEYFGYKPALPTRAA